MPAWYFIVLCWSALVAALSVHSAIDARPPNIVLILADDVGREVLGCYGGSSYQTPHIDRLAAKGMRFDHAYVMPVCHPTRTTLLTGQYPFRLGHPDWGTFPREAERRTLAAMLKRAGYATAVAGKWQLTLLKDDPQQPVRMGFDEYSLYGWHEGPWYYQPHIWQNGKRRTDVRERYGPDVICDFIIDFVERNKDRPFFAFYSMSLCHAETNDLDKPAPVGPNGRYDSYAEMVVKMDDRVGRLIESLDQLGLRKNTLIVYLTDNGTARRNLIDADGDRYVYEDVVSKIGDRQVAGGKGTLTDWGTRVPLILNWPGTIQAAAVNRELVDASDILPSLADVAGAPLPENVKLDGHSLPALSRHNVGARRWVFAEHEGDFFVRNQRWKLYGEGRFFDMNSDADETNLLDAGKLRPDAAAALSELQQAAAQLRDN
jgi:arylsulfatase A